MKENLFGVPRMDKAMLLKTPDPLYLSLFKKADDEGRRKLIEGASFDVVARIANNDKEFEFYCQRPELKEHWQKLWCSYGIILTKQQNISPTLFFSQNSANTFNLIRGTYFFYLAQRVAKEMKADFLYSEVEYLIAASKYGSVHALQRYNYYLYSQIKSANNEEKEAIFRQIIKNSRLMPEDYGSYGYMVLAEALGCYALWLLKCHQLNKAEKIVTSALKSLDYAAGILEESTYSIHNASLGQGLKMSNSLGLESPEQAKKVLIEQFEELRASMVDRHSETSKFSL